MSQKIQGRSGNFSPLAVLSRGLRACPRTGALFLVGLLAQQAAAQTLLASGRVLDAQAVGIANVVVQLKGDVLRDTTDGNGAWSLYAPVAASVKPNTDSRGFSMSIDAGAAMVNLPQVDRIEMLVYDMVGSLVWSHAANYPAGANRLKFPRGVRNDIVVVRAGKQEIREKIGFGANPANSGRLAARTAATGTIQFLTLGGQILSEVPAPAAGGTLNKTFRKTAVTGRFHNGDSVVFLDTTNGHRKMVPGKVLVDWKPSRVKGLFYGPTGMLGGDFAYDPATLSYSGFFLDPATSGSAKWTARVLVLDPNGHVAGIDSMAFTGGTPALAMNDINYWNALPIPNIQMWDFDGTQGPTIKDQFRFYPDCEDPLSSLRRGSYSRDKSIYETSYEWSLDGAPWVKARLNSADSGSPIFLLDSFFLPDQPGDNVLRTRCTDLDSNVVERDFPLTAVTDPPSASFDLDLSKIYTIKDPLAFKVVCSDKLGYIVHSDWRLNGGAWIPLGLSLAGTAIGNFNLPAVGGNAVYDYRCVDDDSNSLVFSKTVPVLLDAPKAELLGVSGWGPLKYDSAGTDISWAGGFVNVLARCSDSLGWLAHGDIQISLAGTGILSGGTYVTLANGWVFEDYRGLGWGVSPAGAYDFADKNGNMASGFYAVQGDHSLYGIKDGVIMTKTIPDKYYGELFNAQIPLDLKQGLKDGQWVVTNCTDLKIKVNCTDDDGTTTTTPEWIYNTCTGYVSGQ